MPIIGKISIGLLAESSIGVSPSFSTSGTFSSAALLSSSWSMTLWISSKCA